MAVEQLRPIRTRFAPSPTGALHMGGLRTALINYLFAKQHDGEFILRIEDTDRERNQSEQIRKIWDSLVSMSIIPDESPESPGEVGPYLQSERLDKYIYRINQLLRAGKVYRCFCESNELGEQKTHFYSGKCRNLSREQIKEKIEKKIPHCVRLKVDQSKVYIWKDYVRGEMLISATALGDIILMRSNGLPTYNFAVTVDDYEMRITDIFRGEEHISNTPYQLALYEAFGWKDSIPRFGHLSLILSESGKKISKRDEDASKYFVDYFLEKGYYPEAILNYLLILGWSEGEREFFRLGEAIKSFSTTGLSGSPSTFDFKKLEWMSQSHLNHLDLHQYLNFVLPFFSGKTQDYELNLEQKKEFAIRFRSRVKYATFLNELANSFYSSDYLTEKVMKQLRGFSEIILLVKSTLESLEKQSSKSFEEEKEIQRVLKTLCVTLGIKKHDFYTNLRLVLTGETEGLPLLSIFFLLGLEKSKSRLQTALELLERE